MHAAGATVKRLRATLQTAPARSLCGKRDGERAHTTFDNRLTNLRLAIWHPSSITRRHLSAEFVLWRRLWR
jgi:hypothetical protein